MKYLLPLLLLTAPAVAEPQISGEQICNLVEHELDQAVQFDLINEKQAMDVLIRCFVNYS